ncbi:hypothetical protein [Xanthomonas sp. 60]
MATLFALLIALVLLAIVGGLLLWALSALCIFVSRLLPPPKAGTPRA